MITGLLIELNCRTSMNKISIKAMTNAFPKKGSCFCLLFTFTGL